MKKRDLLWNWIKKEWFILAYLGLIISFAFIKLESQLALIVMAGVIGLWGFINSLFYVLGKRSPQYNTSSQSERIIWFVLICLAAFAVYKTFSHFEGTFDGNAATMAGFYLGLFSVAISLVVLIDNQIFKRAEDAERKMLMSEQKEVLDKILAKLESQAPSEPQKIFKEQVKDLPSGEQHQTDVSKNAKATVVAILIFALINVMRKK
ncbi:hypothetical protein AWM68_17285 [Fictibacillus phosphorivorans]|uniref:Uncharacterized protein n=1 Tax=Fictibacillus phosphorivorans TaxID=1221500 RepID=A0A163S0Y9_9BACL|nr:hypothetical protein [Fictibacillus phosphorivorans]KZE67927.1 hypothetical protein AWM68_17285 [Fictibacillus phosphorivorans]